MKLKATVAILFVLFLAGDSFGCGMDMATMMQMMGMGSHNQPPVSTPAPQSQPPVQAPAQPQPPAQSQQPQTGTQAPQTNPEDAGHSGHQ